MQLFGSRAAYVALCFCFVTAPIEKGAVVRATAQCVVIGGDDLVPCAYALSIKSNCIILVRFCIKNIKLILVCSIIILN